MCVLIEPVSEIARWTVALGFKILENESPVSCFATRVDYQIVRKLEYVLLVRNCYGDMERD